MKEAAAVSTCLPCWSGIPCLGLNGGPFRHNEAFSFQIATENQEHECGFAGSQGKPNRITDRFSDLNIAMTM